MVIGVVLIAVAIVLAHESYSLIIGESASAETRGLIRKAIEGDPAVSRLLKLYTLHLAPEEILVAAVADFEDDLTTAEIEAAIRRLHDAIRAVQETPRARFILIEPASPAVVGIASRVGRRPRRTSSRADGRWPAG